MMKKLNAAIAAIGLLALPALASAAPVQDQDQQAVRVLGSPNQGREAVSVSVSTEGLDLTRAGDIGRLRNRAMHAVDEACNPKGYLNPTGTRDWRCYREMSASVERATSRLAGNLASN